MVSENISSFSVLSSFLSLLRSQAVLLIKSTSLTRDGQKHKSFRIISVLSIFLFLSFPVTVFDWLTWWTTPKRRRSFSSLHDPVSVSFYSLPLSHLPLLKGSSVDSFDWIHNCLHSLSMSLNLRVLQVVKVVFGHWNRDWILSAGRHSLSIFSNWICMRSASCWAVCELLSRSKTDDPRWKRESKLSDDDSARCGCNCDKLPSIFRTNHHFMCTWICFLFPSVFLSYFLRSFVLQPPNGCS